MAKKSQRIRKSHELDRLKERYLERLRDERRLSTSSLSLYERELSLLLDLIPSSEDCGELRKNLRSQAPATATRKLIIWRSFLATCRAPWATLLDDIQAPKLRQMQPLFLDENESFLLEHACYKSSFLNRDRLLVGLMLQLGLRLSEVLQLKFKNFESDWLIFIRKGENQQRLPLTPAVKTLFQAVQNERNANSDDFVFEGRGRERLSSRGAQMIIDRLRKAAKIEKKITPHSLRHTFASTLAAKGASLAALKEILGHKKITTTERYLHVTPDHLRETLTLLNK